MTPMKWFYSFLKEYRPRIILGLFMVAVMAGAALVSPAISGHAAAADPGAHHGDSGPCCAALCGSL